MKSRSERQKEENSSKFGKNGQNKKSFSLKIFFEV